MDLIQCTVENDCFRHLREQWRQQIDEEDSAPAELYAPHLDHAELECQKPTSQHGGIYAVVSDGAGPTKYHALVHMNFASVRRVVRVVWNFLAPEYIGESVSGASLAPIYGAVLRGAHTHLTSIWTDADELKVYCRTHDERVFYENAVSYLAASNLDIGCKRGGAWLHIGPVAKK